jgi:hypothetical protein
MDGLVPAYFETNEIQGDELKPVEYPIWISAHAMPEDRSIITIEQLYESKAEVWLAMSEYSRYGFRVGGTHGQDQEWLAWSAIPESRIKAVYPYDGDVLHEVQGTAIVRSKSSPEYFFDCASWMWRTSRKQSYFSKCLRHLCEKANKFSADKGLTKKKRRLAQGIAKMESLERPTPYKGDLSVFGNPADYEDDEPCRKCGIKMSSVQTEEKLSDMLRALDLTAQQKHIHRP